MRLHYRQAQCTCQYEAVQETGWKFRHPQNLSILKLDTTLIQSQAIFRLYRIAFCGHMNSNGLEQHQSFTHLENRGRAIWPIGFMH